MVVVVEALVVGLVLVLELELETVGPEAGSDAPPVAELGRATAAAILVMMMMVVGVMNERLKVSDEGVEGEWVRVGSDM